MKKILNAEKLVKIKKFDIQNTFWLLLTLAPILCYVFLWLSKISVSAEYSFENIPTLANFMYTYFGLTEESAVVSCFNDVFGITGVFPIFSDISMIYLISWYVYVKILHIFADVLLFLPDVCHGFILKLTRKGDNDYERE